MDEVRVSSEILVNLQYVTLRPLTCMKTLLKVDAAFLQANTNSICLSICDKHLQYSTVFLLTAHSCSVYTVRE